MHHVLLMLLSILAMHFDKSDDGRVIRGHGTTDIMVTAQYKTLSRCKDNYQETKNTIWQ
jgi:hypothetical protein